MKKIVLALVFGSLSLAGFSHGAQALNATSQVYTSPVEPTITDINTRALKDFQIRFDNVVDVRWSAYKNGYVSYFIQNGNGNRAYYTKKGRWQFSLILYGEDKLPRDIRATVKSTYYDMTITTVEEVQSIYGIVYLVHLEDKSNLKIVRVNNSGDMDILLELIK